MEIRDPLMKYLKEKLPETPEFIIQDLFYKNNKNASKADIQAMIETYGNYEWELKNNFPINHDIFDDDTKRRLGERADGSKNPYNVPNDKERFETQKKLIMKRGLPKEPIILVKSRNKYELLEGWHRIITLLSVFPEGFNYPNVYVGRLP